MASATGIFCIIARIIYVAVRTLSPFTFVIPGINSPKSIMLFKFDGIPGFCGMAFGTTVHGKNASVSRTYRYSLGFFAAVASCTVCRKLFSIIAAGMAIITTNIMTSNQWEETVVESFAN